MTKSDPLVPCAQTFQQTPFGGWVLVTGCRKLFYVPYLPPEVARITGDCPECGAPILVRVLEGDTHDKE